MNSFQITKYKPEFSRINNAQEEKQTTISIWNETFVYGSEYL